MWGTPPISDYLLEEVSHQLPHARLLPRKHTVHE